VAGAGWPLGALEAIGGTTRWYEPVTETPVVGLSGDVETLYDVLEDNFDMAMAYLSTMGRAWLRAMERIADTHPELLKQFFGTESMTLASWRSRQDRNGPALRRRPA
jgi:hypothetical protein